MSAYALSPIDLIPDFIPVLGYLDDLLIVPGGIWLAIGLIPPDLMGEFRAAARRRADKPTGLIAAVLIALIWIGFIVGTHFLYTQWRVEAAPVPAPLP